MFKFITTALFGSILMSLTAAGQVKQDTMNKKTFYDFVSAINEHNAEKLYALMTDDHQFIDAQGNKVIGKDKMKAGWAGYFQWFLRNRNKSQSCYGMPLWGFQPCGPCEQSSVNFKRPHPPFQIAIIGLPVHQW